MLGSVHGGIWLAECECGRVGAPLSLGVAVRGVVARVCPGDGGRDNVPQCLAQPAGGHVQQPLFDANPVSTLITFKVLTGLASQSVQC